MRSVNCPVCQTELELAPAQSRKKKRLCLMLVCPASATHFRAFINDQEFVKQVMARLDGSG